MKLRCFCLFPAALVAGAHLSVFLMQATRTNQRPSDVSAQTINEKDGLQYVWIPAGKFRMGCSVGDGECDPDESPPHTVNITKGFWLGRTEVTQAAYEKVIGNNPSQFRGTNFPQNNVNWEQAQAYCHAIGGRLPTEAEWEYAARAGTAGARYGDLGRSAWYFANSGRKVHEVATKVANRWGLYDMLGNVWEWTTDWYDPNYYSSSPSNDPMGPSSGTGRALLGGSWNSDPVDLRVSGRGRFGPLYRAKAGNEIGFRCVSQ